MAKGQMLREEINDEYKWDLSTIYKNVDEFNQDYDLVIELIDDYSKYENTMMNSAKNLLDSILDDIKISRLINKLYMYAHLSSDSDTSNTYYQELKGKISNLDIEYSKISSFVLPTLLKEDYSKIEKFYEEEPKLLEHKFSLENIFRYKEHTLNEREEKMLSTLSGALSNSEDIYDVFTNSDMSFGTIKDENNEEIELTDTNYARYIRSKDRRVRSDAFKLLLTTYSKYQNTFAKIISGDVKSSVAVAEIKNYSSALEASLFSDNIEKNVYDNLINSVHSNLEPLYHYFDLKKEMLNLEELHLYDTYTSVIPNSTKEYTFDEARDLVIDALSVLGDDYINDLKKAFSERWIDIYPNKGKTSGAYSSGSYDTNPFVLLNFNGTLNDVSTLAHELGHSMHSYYSRLNNPYQYSNYKIFVAEVASTVNELLLANYLLKNSNDDKLKLVVLNDLLDMFKGTIYRQTMFAEFEKKMYDIEENKEVITHEVLSNIYYDLNKLYFGDRVIVDNEIRYEWMRIPHFYYNFYVYKYATGLSAACHIVKRILNNEENALEDYLTFLSSGGRDYPLNELKIAGVDMTEKYVVDSAIDMFKEYLCEFETLYKRVEK